MSLKVPSLSCAVGAIAVLGAGLACLLTGHDQVGVSLLVAGAAELGVKAVV